MPDEREVLHHGLIESLIPQVRVWARVVTRKYGLPQHVDIDELISEGYMACIDLARRFDPCKGASFRTFAHRRVMGSMIDYLRRQDGGRRSPIERATIFLQIGDVLTRELVDPGPSLTDKLIAEEFYDERRKLLLAATAHWPAHHRQLLAYYLEHDTGMREAGATVDLSQCRVSQILTEAVKAAAGWTGKSSKPAPKAMARRRKPRRRKANVVCYGLGSAEEVGFESQPDQAKRA